MLVEIADIKVIKHSPMPCRYCGEKSEFGCCSILLYCPKCGCPQRKPLNKEIENGKG